METIDRARYESDGFLVLRGVFSPEEMAAVGRETEQLLERPDLMDKQNLRVRWQYHYDTCAPVFELYDPIIDISPQCDAIARDARIRDALEALFGDQVDLIGLTDK